MSTLSQSSWNYRYDDFAQLYLEHTTDGHYKFYEMTNIGGGMWRARWGRIEAPNGQTMEYNSREWEKILGQKLRKGYVLERTTDIKTQSTTVNNAQGSTTVVKVNKSWAVDPVFIERIELVRRTAEAKNAKKDIAACEEVLYQYKKTGVLTKGQMLVLNDIYTRNIKA